MITLKQALEEIYDERMRRLANLIFSLELLHEEKESKLVGEKPSKTIKGAKVPVTVKDLIKDLESEKKVIEKQINILKELIEVEK